MSSWVFVITMSSSLNHAHQLLNGVMMIFPLRVRMNQTLTTRDTCHQDRSESPLQEIPLSVEKKNDRRREKIG